MSVIDGISIASLMHSVTNNKAKIFVIGSVLCTIGVGYTTYRASKKLEGLTDKYESNETNTNKKARLKSRLL